MLQIGLAPVDGVILVDVGSWVIAAAVGADVPAELVENFGLVASCAVIGRIDAFLPVAIFKIEVGAARVGIIELEDAADVRVVETVVVAAVLGEGGL